MASGTRFDPSSGISEGSTITACYPNGQRGSFSSSSLDKSNIFQEGNDCRTMSNGVVSSRGDARQYADFPSTSQCLNLDPIPVAEQKITRLAEFKRLLSISANISTEDVSVGAFLHTKPLPPTILDELKRVKSSISEGTARAKDRAKLMDESIMKLDKYRQVILSRKRSRGDGLPNDRSSSLLHGDRSAPGTNLMKAGPHTKQLLDVASRRSDDRAKTMNPSKRIRTSMVDVRQTEARNDVLPRPSGFVEKDRELLKPTNGASVHAEKKGLGLSSGGDGWEKMKKKRTMGLAANRNSDGDQDTKRTPQQRSSSDNRSRLSDVNGFRSGCTSAMGGVTKLNGAAQATVRAIPTVDPDNIPMERKDRVAGADKERITIKGLTKQNIHDGNQAGNSSPLPKSKASRGPRTGLSSSLNSSTSLSQTPCALEGWELSAGLNKAQGIHAIDNNRKRPPAASSLKSSSNQVAQWVGQRVQKSSRVARRASLFSPAGNKDEALVPTEEFPCPDTGARLISVEANGSALVRRAMNTSHQVKRKLENVPSPAFSESEKSGAADKSKNKAKVSNGTGDKVVSSIPKATNFGLQPKKNNVCVKEETDDGVQRQGRTGRLLVSSRACLPPREKLDVPTVSKQRSTRPVLVSDKIKSKSGRPPTKKVSDRKASIRPGLVANVATDFTDEADDHEELIEAATFARKATYDACSSLFWHKMEPFFSIVTSDDIACLQEESRLAEELENSLCFASDVNLNMKERFTSYLPMNEEKQKVQQNELFSNGSGNSIDDSQDVDSQRIRNGRWFEKIIPLSQRLLAALIVEDEVADSNDISGTERELHKYTSDDSACGAFNHTDAESNSLDKNGFELEPEVEIINHVNHVPDNFARDVSIMENGFRSSKMENMFSKGGFTSQNGLALDSSVGQQHKVPGLQCDIARVRSVDCSYEQMSLDDRILLELQSIGLYPELVPDLAQGEDDEISRHILKLQEDLFHQVKKRRSQLCKLEKAVKSREVEERSLERQALNKLVDIAYKKYMVSHSKSGANKVPKQVAASFVKRTLARCRKFEQTGMSCFPEHLFMDEVLPAPIDRCNDADKEALAAKPHPESFTSQHESKAAGSSFSLSDGLGKDSCDPSLVKDDAWPNRGKKKELLLDDVGNAPRGTSNLGSNPLAGAKGKRSERDKDHGRDGAVKNSVAKAGRPTIGGIRSDRKNKTKPQEKTSQTLHSADQSAEVPSSTPQPTRKPGSSAGCAELREALPRKHGNEAPVGLVDGEGPVDLSNLPLPGIDELDVTGVQDQDLDSWFGCVEGMQDHDNDFEGPLPIPMDDLSVVF